MIDIVKEDESINEVCIARNPTEITRQNESSNVESLKLKIYKKRWLVLAAYFISVLGSMFQWLEYGIISNIVARYHIFLRIHVVLNIKSYYS